LPSRLTGIRFPGIKKPPVEEVQDLFAGNYILAVLDLSLQQDLEVFEQHDLPQCFFFPLPFPLSANEAPVTNKAAVANKNTFFIVMILCDEST